MEEAIKDKHARQPRVLVIDDDTTHRKMMELISDHLGVECAIVSDCNAAMEAVKDASFDVILMDWRMPITDGRACTMKLREIDSAKDTPIVAVTALAMAGDREACLEAGVNDYLPKPFTIGELKKTISKWTSEVTAKQGQANDPVA